MANLSIETFELALLKGYKGKLSVSQCDLQTWLRKKHNLHVIPYIDTFTESKLYRVCILKPRQTDRCGCDDLTPREVKMMSFTEYEHALEVGLNYTLEKL